MSKEVYIHPTYNGNFMFFCTICGKGHEFSPDNFNGDFKKPTVTSTITGCGAILKDGVLYKDQVPYEMEVF